MTFAKASRVTQDYRIRTSVRARSFKVYSDTDKVKADGETAETARKSLIPLRRTSVLVTKGATSTSAKDLKGSSTNMGKGKGKSGGAETTTVGRKALADVSNLAGNSSKNFVRDGTKLMKGKSERTANVQRISIGPCSRVLNISSRKAIVGKEREKLSLGGGNVHTLKRDEDTKSSTDGQMTQSKNSRLAAGASGTRKSLPALKRMNLTHKSNLKENHSGSEAKEVSEGKEVSRVSKKAVPRVASARSHLWKNRASDGSTLTASSRKSNVDAHPFQRKSIKIQTTVKTTLKNSNSQKKSTCVLGKNKSKSIAVISSKEEVATSKVSNEDAQGEVSSNSNSKPTTDASDVTTRKSNRRRSFTSSLVARSKLPEAYAEVTEQEKLPSIDDEGNQLEVAEYVDDIYQYYWVAEAQNPPLGNYMSIQPDITPPMRGILINWLVEVHFKFDLMQETLYLTINLLDRYLSQVQIKKNEMQLIGLTALLLASKYEDFWHPRVKDLISISAESYTREQILGMEKLMLKKLKFRLNVPTPYVFMLRFLKAAQSSPTLENLAFYLIELCLVEYEALNFKSSLLCASAIYVARCALHMTPVWTPLLTKHARYDVPQMMDCADMILRVHKAAKTGKLKVTYQKYKNHDLSSAAAIRPLDKLPQ